MTQRDLTSASERITHVGGARRWLILSLAIACGVMMLPVVPATAQDGGDEKRMLTPSEALAIEIEGLLDDLAALRRRVATAELESAKARTELAELQQFIADHDEYGRDFAEYEAIKARLDREAREAEQAQRRAAYEARKAERQRKYQEARARAMAERGEQDRQSSYRRNGFTHIGLDVFTSKMAFHYKTRNNTRSMLEYDPAIGHYPRVFPEGDEMDFSSMTISGSVMNASEQVRNIGVAVVFFDNHGNQVGHEVVQIANARPNVPYPFTSTIEMALNRPFSSSSSYVLYADPAVAPAAGGAGGDGGAGGGGGG